MCIRDSLRGDDTLLSEDNDFQCNTTVAQSNLRVDEDGCIFVQPTTTISTNQEQLEKDILARINPSLSDKQKQQLVDLILKFWHLIPENAKKPARTLDNIATSN